MSNGWSSGLDRLWLGLDWTTYDWTPRDTWALQNQDGTRHTDVAVPCSLLPPV